MTDRLGITGTIVQIFKQEEYRWYITIEDDKGERFSLHLNVDPDRRAPEVGDEVEI
jgi:hypothetical protein